MLSSKEKEERDEHKKFLKEERQKDKLSAKARKKQKSLRFPVLG